MATFDDDDRAVQGRAIFEGLGGVFQNLTGKSYDDVTSDEMTGSPRSMLQYLFPGRSDRQHHVMDRAQRHSVLSENLGTEHVLTRSATARGVIKHQLDGLQRALVRNHHRVRAQGRDR